MTNQNQLEDLLSERGDEIFGDDARTPHLDDQRIEGAMAAESGFTPPELSHLAACAQCRTVVAMVVSDAEVEAPANNVIPLWRNKWVAPALAVAASLTVAVMWQAAEPQEPAYAYKGASVVSTAEVTYLATDTQGNRRDLRPGDTIQIGERLGFKYGDPDGTHRTLTVLAWDNQDVHWFYPDGPGKPAFTLSDDLAVGVRMPFDIELDGDFKAGELTIVAVFDLEPGAAASALRTGALEEANTIRIKVVEAQP